MFQFTEFGPVCLRALVLLILFFSLGHFHYVCHLVYALNLFLIIIPRVFFSGGHTTHHLLSRKRTCIPTAVVVTLSSSATRLPPLCTVVLYCSFRNHLHRHCYHRHQRHHRQSKFIECGHTAHHARLHRRTSQALPFALMLTSPPSRPLQGGCCHIFYLLSVLVEEGVRIFL